MTESTRTLSETITSDADERMSTADRWDRLERAIDEGRVARWEWVVDATPGREHACLLYQLAPEIGAAGGSDRCPADVLPPWLARLTIWIGNAPSADLDARLRRYASVTRRASQVLDVAAWRRAEGGALAAIVEEARRYAVGDGGDGADACDRVAALCHRVEPVTGEWLAAIVEEARRHAVGDVADACDTVVALCRRIEAGDEPAAGEWAEAAAETEARARAAEAARAVGRAAGGAAWAARAAKWAARASAEGAAYAAVAAVAAESEESEAEAEAAEAAACDRMVDGMLDAIERQVAAG